MNGVKIALTGKMRSGKDTVGDFLKKEYGFRKFAFAEGIKFVCGSLGLEPADDGKPRALYQGVGQDLRKYDPDVWIKYTFRKIAEKTSEDDNIVVTDVRQPNEVAYLKSQGFTVIKIHADAALRIQRMEAAGDFYSLGDLDHETERAVDTLEVDFTINNNGTVEDLHFILSELMFIMFDLYELPIWDNDGEVA